DVSGNRILNQTHTMQDEYGLVSYWNFEPQLSDTGFANDTQKANNGTVNGGATLTPDGRIGHAYSFDGNNDYIDVGTGSSLYPSTFTLEAWIKGTSSASPRGIFSVGYNEGASQGVYLIANTDNSLNFQVYDGSDAVATTTAAGLITNDVWHHVATTFDGSNTEVYVDGIVKATNTQDPVEFDTNTNVYIGTYSAGNWRFSGTIDEARIYKRALSAEEIEYSYLKGKSFFDKSQNLTIGSDVVVVDVTSGNVGIGENDPIHLLQVRGTASGQNTRLAVYNAVTPDGSETGGILALSLHDWNAAGAGGGNSDVEAGDILGEIWFEGQGTDYTFQGGSIKSTVITGDGDDVRNNIEADLSFWTKPNGQAGTSQRMVIDEDGNVGIGTTAPSAVLEVAGSVEFSNLGSVSDDRYVCAIDSTGEL
ncbi:MAG: LamG domain-containing protein, partial [Anaerolineales bacterium]|nr:LamG domain-containing protein [Anaerolineales bacterium]